MMGGSLTLQDSLTLSFRLDISQGTFNANNYNVTMGGYFTITNTTATRSLIMGNGTWTINCNSSCGATRWHSTTLTGFTFDPGGSTILISDSLSTARTFVANGLTYNKVIFSGSSTGAVTITGSGNYNVLTVVAPRTLTFTSGTTQRVNRFVALGTSSNPITLNASTGGSVATLSMPGANTFVGDYLTITDLNATGGAKWYAGANSTLSNSSGWLLQAGPQRRGSFIQDAKVRLEKGRMIINAR
jgi:hypothetical protein